MLPLPVFALLDPTMMRPDAMGPLMIVWAFVTSVFLFTLWHGRLSAQKFAPVAAGGILGIAASALLIADSGAAYAVLSLVAVIPTIVAVSSPVRMTYGFVLLSVVTATLVSVLIASSIAPMLVATGAIIGAIIVPVFLVLALRHSLEEILERQTRLNSVDPLTGLLNRRGLHSRVSPLLAAAHASDEPVGVLLMDIDRFKEINDCHGHLVGDGVLLSAAATIQRIARPGSVVCRFGGEEFLVFCLPGTIADLEEYADSFRAAVAENSPVTISIGGVFSPLVMSDGQDERDSGALRELLEIADRCVYQAKANGRNQIFVEPSAPVAWTHDAHDQDLGHPNSHPYRLSMAFLSFSGFQTPRQREVTRVNAGDAA
ncbi:hypothetical protein GORHZ_149_00070 [Gordonia rhizosphera NBRC 16068]|uniref:GGDEF domain-containing protein n=1 Tax=Gordonia rhizosphera NBRC 16068 TaxID=1108045 RepID=K6WDL6_9ACTN|nr:hypothetical protein GORHZ_149_00070 [Gordonia rhizosphera NBRC 16068]